MNLSKADGGEVTIVGGGPSLQGFDFTQIPENHYIIAPNRSAWVIPRADMMVTVDKTFARNMASEIAKLSSKVTCIMGLPTGFGWEYDFGSALRVLHRRDIPFSSNLFEGLSGLNSGYASLNMAYILGARKVNLLGFDMHTSADRKHWHEGYAWHHPKHANIFRSWASQFHKAATVLEPAGVEVVNHVGPAGSAIDTFPTQPLERFAGSGYKVEHEHSI